MATATITSMEQQAAVLEAIAVFELLISDESARRLLEAHQADPHAEKAVAGEIEMSLVNDGFLSPEKIAEVEAFDSGSEDGLYEQLSALLDLLCERGGKANVANPKVYRQNLEVSVFYLELRLLVEGGITTGQAGALRQARRTNHTDGAEGLQWHLRQLYYYYRRSRKRAKTFIRQ